MVVVEEAHEIVVLIMENLEMQEVLGEEVLIAILVVPQLVVLLRNKHIPGGNIMVI